MSGIGAEGRKAGFVKGAEASTSAAVTVQEAKKKVQAADGPTMDKVGREGVPNTQEFDFEYLDGRGRRWAGHFKTHVLTFRERIDVGLIRSRLTGGVAPTLLDLTTSNLLEVMAHLSIAIDTGPDWARDLGAIHDTGVGMELYKEVLAHEQRFHESGPSDPSKADDAQHPRRAGTEDLGSNADAAA